MIPALVKVTSNMYSGFPFSGEAQHAGFSVPLPASPSSLCALRSWPRSVKICACAWCICSIVWLTNWSAWPSSYPLLVRAIRRFCTTVKSFSISARASFGLSDGSPASLTDLITCSAIHTCSRSHSDIASEEPLVISAGASSDTICSVFVICSSRDITRCCSCLDFTASCFASCNS